MRTRIISYMRAAGWFAVDKLYGKKESIQDGVERVTRLTAAAARVYVSTMKWLIGVFAIGLHGLCITVEC